MGQSKEPEHRRGSYRFFPPRPRSKRRARISTCCWVATSGQRS